MRGSSFCRNNAKPTLNCLILLIAVLACGGLSLPGFALDPARALSQYVHHAWGAEQGFSGGSIYAISRSSDGYLWLGTDRGLVRFDGTTFELIQRPIARLPRIGRVRGLASDAQGTLWIQPEGVHMLVYRDGRFSDAVTSMNAPEATMTAMALDEHGDVLLSGLGNETLRFANGKLQAIGNAESATGTVTSIAEARDGRIWMGTRDSGLFVIGQGHISKVPRPFADEKINALATDFNGGLWVGTDHGIYHMTPQGDLSNRLPEWTRQLQILTIFRDRDACVWAGTNNGLIRITPSFEASFRRSTDGREVSAIFQDREFNLWFGGPGGLERLQDGVFSTYSSAEGIPVLPIGPVFADDNGGVWFAPLAGGLFWLRGGQLQQIREEGLDRDVVYSIDGTGADVWIGRQRGGLTHLHRVGEKLFPQTFREKDGLAQNSVYAVHVSRTGTVWAGTLSGGVSVFSGSGFVTYNTSNGLSSNAVNSIAESRDGSVWVATPNGLDQFRGKQWIQWTTERGLPSPNVSLCFADSHSVVWAVTSDGLSHLSGGHFVRLASLPDLIGEPILGIAEDQLGFLWLSTSDRVFRINRSALISDSLHSGDLQSYGTSDGLSAIEPLRRERSMVTDPSGKVWLSLRVGITSGDPRLTDRDSTPIQVRIDSVSANGRAVNFENESRIPAGTRSMTFHYSSDSLFAPERVRFRYRLENAEEGWSEAVGSREVLYKNLGPGKFRLHIVASRDGALWNSPETTYAFSIAPGYLETWWFRGAAALAIVLSILLVMRLRSVRLAQQLNARFQERLSERTRIAQELHDTLLQSFQGLMLRFQTVANLLPGRPADARAILEQALEKADSALAESRNAIQNIRGTLSRDTSLAESINDMMAELAEEYSQQGGHQPSYSVVVEGVPKRVRPWVSAEVLRIAQECLRNAFQHSGAGQIEAELSFEDSHFGLRFRDNGVGIDPEVLKKGSRFGHWGMIGIRERASQIGAKLELWSKPGAGTELDLRLPGHIAYERTKKQGLLQRLRERVEKRHEFRSSNQDPDS